MKPTTLVQTIPGSLDSKTVTVELDTQDACKTCGAYPTIGLWTFCDRCMQPVCDGCAVQGADGVFHPACFADVSTVLL